VHIPLSSEIRPFSIRPEIRALYSRDSSPGSAFGCCGPAARQQYRLLSAQMTEPPLVAGGWGKPVCLECERCHVTGCQAGDC